MHALGNTAHCDIFPRLSRKGTTHLEVPSAESVLKGVNAKLREKNHLIQLNSVWKLPQDSMMHARYSAINRYYRYLVVAPKNQSTSSSSLTTAAPNRHRGSTSFYSHGPLHCRDSHTYLALPLQLPKLLACLDAIQGTWDFSLFRAAGCTAPSPVRTITHASVDISDIPVHLTAEGGVPRADAALQLYTFHLHSPAFLYRQIVNIMGFMLRVGMGMDTVTSFRESLLPALPAPSIQPPQSRRHMPAAAPAQGLYLTQVTYPPAMLEDAEHASLW